MSEFLVFPDADHLARAAAQRFAALASNAIAERGRFTVALAGGSTPRPFYLLLAGPPGAQVQAVVEGIDWTHVQVFWGDERCVPPSHPDSNYRMARRALLDRVPIPPENVHRMRGELPPEEGAAAYRWELQQALGADGRLDVVFLGLGTDGHTASLFPGSAALHQRQRSVVAVCVEKLASWRLTLTLPVINAARHVIFLVAGQSKADPLAGVRAGEPLPAAMVQPARGQLTWLVDRDAAAGLEPR